MDNYSLKINLLKLLVNLNKKTAAQSSLSARFSGGKEEIWDLSNYFK